MEKHNPCGGHPGPESQRNSLWTPLAMSDGTCTYEAMGWQNSGVRWPEFPGTTIQGLLFGVIRPSLRSNGLETQRCGCKMARNLQGMMVW
jgi:hypothetical protein